MYLAEPACLFLPPFQASVCYCLAWLIFHTECFRQGQQQWYRNTQKAQEGGFILTALPFCIQTLTLFSRLSGFKEQHWVFLTCQKLYCRLHALVSPCGGVLEKIFWQQFQNISHLSTDVSLSSIPLEYCCYFGILSINREIFFNKMYWVYSFSKKS